MPKITFLDNGGLIWTATAIVMLFFLKYRKTGIMLGIGLNVKGICRKQCLKSKKSALYILPDMTGKGNSNGKAANTVIDDFIAAGNLRIYPKCHAVNIRKKRVMRQ